MTSSDKYQPLIAAQQRADKTQAFDRILFLGLPLDFFDLSQASLIPAGAFVASLNLENVALAVENPEFKRIISSADLVLADGEAVVLAANYLSHTVTNSDNQPQNKLKKIHKVAGIDLAEILLLKHDRIAILGSTTEVIAKLQEKFAEKIVFAHHGFFALGESEYIARQIGASGAEILLVGMGAPAQEKFIYDYKKYFSSTTALAVGGALDVLAGAHSRAPAWMINLKLEWLFRILQEPFRLKRIFLRVPRFCSLIASTYFYRG